jgi:tetratricopeptide (TPR) repeat protein/energy-coupling factor transporter ATP-binding protein EcfA2
MMVVQTTLLMLLLFSSSNAYALIINKEDPVYYYVNHEQIIKELHKKLSENHVVGITGFTGVGKSELARKYVEKYRGDYDLIAFLDSSTDLIPQFINIANQINAEICSKENCNISQDPSLVKKSLMQYLKSKKRWLLILDNLKINENQKIQDFIDWDHNGHLIICSQDSQYFQNKIMVPYLTKDNIIYVISKIMKDSPKEFHNTLAESVQNFPTYVVARSAIFLHNNNHMTAGEYINYMKRNENKILAHLELVLKEMNLKDQENLFKIALLNNQRIPRYLIEFLIGDKDKTSEFIHNMVRYGLIEQISDDRENQIFRIHEAQKDELLRIRGNDLLKIDIETTLNAVNKFLPESVTDRLAVLKKDILLESNIELLIENAKKYDVSKHHIIQISEKLLWYYLLGSRQSYNAKKLVDWFKNIDNDKIILDTESQKIAYTNFLVYLAGFEFSISRVEPDIAIEYLDRAEKIIENIDNEGELRAYIYATKAHILISIGDINLAEENLNKAAIVRPHILRTFLGSNVGKHLKSKIYIARGQYKEALEILDTAINSPTSIVTKNYNIDKDSVKSILLAPEYITQSKILNYMENYAEAYEIINNNVYEFIKDRSGDEISPVLLARTLIEMSRSELGMQQIEMAEKHINQVINELTRGKDADFSSSTDMFLADALFVRADVLSFRGAYGESVKDYKLSKDIYWNIYGTKNVGNIENLASLLLNAFNAAVREDNKDDSSIWSSYFYKTLISSFGKNHPKSKAASSVYFKK